MDRRAFVASLAAAAAAARSRGASAPGKPPFRVLFSNDTTNILSCNSPYHTRGEPFRPEMLEATVDEVAGVDVHMLQPGLGWIPWWRSDVYPAAEHYRWFAERTGRKPDSFGQYMLDGGDIVQVFLDRCRERGQVPFISYRLNDGHHLENAGTKSPRSIWVSRFYEEHPEYRIGPNPKSWDERVHNWAIPEVRAHKLAFIEELCAKYDLDGIELDFMRHTNLFRLDETTTEQRADIVAQFVEQVRRALDRTARGRRRWLCARVPCLLDQHDREGIDLPRMVAAGVDMVNLSAYYFTQQFHDLARIRPTVPTAAVYLEMTHTTTTGPSRGGYDSFSFRRTADHQFYTTASTAYRHGADGVSLFNFVYYREHGTPGRGPFCEPPFHVLERLADPDWLASQPQWYFLAKSWHTPLPVKLTDGQSVTRSLDLDPRGGTAPGLLRLMTVEDSSACRWRVEVAGRTLEGADYVAHPLPEPYEAGLGGPEQYACFRCPREILTAGANAITVTLEAGGPITLTYLDLVLR